QRHEPAETHDHKRQQALEPSPRVRHRCHSPECAPGFVSTLTVVDRPGRNSPRLAAPSSSAMRTGTRWTIFVKLPGAFSGGITLKPAPAPGARLSTWPWKVLPGSTSATTVAGCPRRICANWSSLKLASTHSPCAGITLKRYAPLAT